MDRRKRWADKEAVCSGFHRFTAFCLIHRLSVAFLVWRLLFGTRVVVGHEWQILGGVWRDNGPQIINAPHAPLTCRSGPEVVCVGKTTATDAVKHRRQSCPLKRPSRFQRESGSGGQRTEFGFSVAGNQWSASYPVDTKPRSSAGSMLVQRLRRWASIDPALERHPFFLCMDRG